MTDQWNQPPADLSEPLKQVRETAKELGGQMSKVLMIELKWASGEIFPWQWRVVDDRNEVFAKGDGLTKDDALADAQVALDEAQDAVTGGYVGQWAKP